MHPECAGYKHCTKPPSWALPFGSGTRLDTIVRRARVDSCGELVDLGITDGAFAAIQPHLRAHAPLEIEAAGRVVIPGLVESHMHLDKALLADRRPNRSGTLDEALRVTADLKSSFTREDIGRRAEAVLRMAIRRGTTTIRAETEFDPTIGLMAIEVVLDLKRRYAGLVDIQVVAFPQEGIYKTPGAEALFWQAMECGADVVGGVPYNDLSAERHIDLCFRIAQEFDKPISLHQDFNDDAVDLSIEYVARKTLEVGWQGRVEVGHATALGALEPSRLAQVAELLRKADISVVTLPQTDLHLGGRGDGFNVRRALAPVRALLDAGVNVACSSNNVRNAFTPYGNADLLQVALLFLAASHLGGADTLPHALKAVTLNAARAIGIAEQYGLKVGRPGTLVVLDTFRFDDAVIDVPERLWVLKQGRVSVVNHVSSEFLLSPNGGWSPDANSAAIRTETSRQWS